MKLVQDCQHVRRAVGAAEKVFNTFIKGLAPLVGNLTLHRMKSFF
jgi:hypothetical protein